MSYSQTGPEDGPERLLAESEVALVAQANALIDEARELQNRGEHARADTVLNAAEGLLAGLPDKGYVLACGSHG